MLAIADRQGLADQAEQLAQEEEEGEPLPCGAHIADGATRFCGREVGHSGRHRYRSINGLAHQAASGLAG